MTFINGFETSRRFGVILDDMWTVAVLIREGISLFEFGVTAEVFGIDRTKAGLPPVDYRVCSDGGPIRVASKHRPAVYVESTHGLGGLVDADVVIVSATLPSTGNEAELRAIREAYASGALVVSLCSGAFILAESGILDGLSVSTHWLFEEELARRFPTVEVVSANLFTDTGRVVTGAGTAAAIDTCLHVVRRELGAAAASTIAKRMVTAPLRHGGQQQFVDWPSRADIVGTDRGETGLAETLDWAKARLGTNLDLAALADRSALSTRQLTRRFIAQVGTTPLKWVTHQRVQRAQELLENTDLSIDQIGHDVGYSSATQLREHFRALVGTTPSAYRESFNLGA